MEPRWGGKEKIIVYLMAKEGYSHAKARKLVDVVIAAIISQLAAGNDVEIEGLGKLHIYTRKQRRAATIGLRRCGPTIVDYHKHKKSVKLKKDKKLKLED